MQTEPIWARIFFLFNKIIFFSYIPDWGDWFKVVLYWVKKIRIKLLMESQKVASINQTSHP
jgi:hypothetical protein